MKSTKPLMIFDGDCGFCRRWVGRWRELTATSVDYAPYQEVAAHFPDIPADEFKKAVQFVEPGGARSSGAEAVFRSLSYSPRGGRALWCYRHFPLVRPLTEAGYRMIASHRGAAARVTQLFWGDHVEEPQYDTACRIFLRSLGAIYLISFCSLWVQVSGLVGHNGILPLASFLDAVHRYTGPKGYYLLPTLSWFSAADAFTQLLCGFGALVSLVLVTGFAPAPCLSVLWALYLSLSCDFQDFLSFQWDALLLEAGFLAIFLAPFRLRLSVGPRGTSRLFHFLLRWLLFRLMFSSGFVKLASGDSTWRDLSALRFHFETQPLPTWIGWYAHQIPDSIKAAMAAVMFFIELVAPFFIFLPRRLRLGAFSLLVLLQVVIALTGNYAFFNLLTLALCVLLLDDRVWPRRWRKPDAFAEAGTAATKKRRWPDWCAGFCGGMVMLFSSMAFTSTLGFESFWPQPAVSLYRKVLPFRTFNRYGLFAVMTTTRPEIVVEGSNDGSLWLPYAFKYKPGDPEKRPGFVAPHQPRLDWQMWFAALGRSEENPWFENLMIRLLQGSPEVLSLLSGDPFHGHPPRFVRAALFSYRFTSVEERSRTGSWWKREFLGLYFPVRYLEEFDALRKE